MQEFAATWTPRSQLQSIQCHVEDVWGSRNVRPELQHLKLGFIEVHVDPICQALHRLKVQFEGSTVLLLLSHVLSILGGKEIRGAWHSSLGSLLRKHTAVLFAELLRNKVRVKVWYTG